jgi:hypothetical protein
MLDNGNILIANEYHGLVIEVNRNGDIIWRFGFSYIKGFFVLNSIFMIIISSVILYYKHQRLRNIRRKRFSNCVIFGIFTAFLICSIIFIFSGGVIFSAFIRLIYSLDIGIF